MRGGGGGGQSRAAPNVNVQGMRGGYGGGMMAPSIFMPGMGMGQGLTLVHFPAQPQLFLTQKHTLSIP
jgi:hypothetical protein